MSSYIFLFFQGWNQWILVLDVRKIGPGRQGGKFPGNFRKKSRKYLGNIEEMSGNVPGKFPGNVR